MNIVNKSEKAPEESSSIVKCPKLHSEHFKVALVAEDRVVEGFTGLGRAREQILVKPKSKYTTEMLLASEIRMSHKLL